MSILCSCYVGFGVYFSAPVFALSWPVFLHRTDGADWARSLAWPLLPWLPDWPGLTIKTAEVLSRISDVGPSFA